MIYIKDNMICIKHYQIIDSLTEQLCVIQINDCCIVIEGECLNVFYYCHDEIRIQGKLSRIDFR